MRKTTPTHVVLVALIAALGCGPSGETAEAPTPETKVAPDPQVTAELEMFDGAMGKSKLGDDAKAEVMEAFREAPIFKNRFMGIRTLQNPTDAWILMEIFWEVKPDLIVETGTFHGGSAVLWAIIMRHINPDIEIITIDIEDQREPLAKRHPIARKYVSFLLGSSTALRVVAEVHRRAEGKRAMVLLDSLHSKDHVAAELAAYAPLVPVGSYIVVQDTMLGPLKAIQEFLEKNPNWVADRARERYADTNSVQGYLRRIR